LAISIVAAGELYEGAYGFPDPDTQLATYRAFLAPIPTLGLIHPIMELFARDRARLRRAGLLIPDLDLLIASTALHYDLMLLTRNRRHFTSDRFPTLKLYQS
jgi:predicted nucleic acid-binding protein